MRRCPDCGLAEERLIQKGRDVVNLDPVTGCCVACLTKRAVAHAKPMDPEPVADYRAKAAKNGELYT